jgi:hypothetical protein
VRQQDEISKSADQLWWLNKPICLEWPEKKTSWRLPLLRHLVKLLAEGVHNRARLDQS